MTNKNLPKLRKVKRTIFLFIFLLVCIWLFRPLSESELASAARYDFEDVLFEMNRIDPALFQGDPVIKRKRGNKWFEWTYGSGSDTLAIGVRVSRCHFGNLFPLKCYIRDNTDLSNKLAWTDPRYAKSKPRYW